nr:MAG: internal scaffolding protein [Microvirus sp.]
MGHKRISNRFRYEGDYSMKFDKDSNEGRSKTCQSFAKEANVNTIVAKYRKTGILVDPLTAAERQPYYGDFSSSSDYFALESRLAAVKSDFARLPGHIRQKFHGNVAEMLDFVVDPANVKEAVELGLLPVSSLPPAPAPKPDDNVPPKAVVGEAPTS